jgi:hypothetical protein
MIFGTSYKIKHVDMSWVVDHKEYSSLNHPIVIVGEDNISYLIKFNKPTDMRIGINELICNLIGLELELPVFEPVIANVSQDIIDSNENLKDYYAGEHFAQIFLEPFETVRIYKNQGKQITSDLIGNVRHVPDFIMFDKYIENFDRHGDNICLKSNSTLANKLDYYLFDHDLSFCRDPDTQTDIKGLREMKHRLQFMEFFVDDINNIRLFDRGIHRLIDLSKNIPELVSFIPKSWKVGYEEYLKSIEILLNKFTVDVAKEHIILNKDKLPLLQ